jgi:hypothetical protein
MPEQPLTVFSLYRQYPVQVVKAKIASLRLPAGVKINPFYDQSTVINGTIQTVKKIYFEGFILVTIILFLFLGNLQAAVITASIIPLDADQLHEHARFRRERQPDELRSHRLRHDRRWCGGDDGKLRASLTAKA